MRVISFEAEMLETEGEEVFHGLVDAHVRQGSGYPGQLQAGLLEMIALELHVSEGLHKITRLETIVTHTKSPS